ncbi:MAG: hypothetical protein CVU51_03160 [Deltaproteobacteria bacterium HGW-Deltaproteobacteria-1]|jgi:hypothetical protein|nr:MAG: hypothetical protein CVU51_03160 [Deltaproteobacteria bacterium HGW-Deltaproteobacteria-1]
MKKCPYCSKEIQNEALKCSHCGKLIDSPTGLREIWDRYWGYIISVPAVIICIASIILSVTNLGKNDGQVPTETNRPSVNQQTTPSANASRPVSWQNGLTPDVLKNMSDEQFKKIVDQNPELAKAGVRYDMHNGKMMRYIPSAEKLASINNQQTSSNNETYNTSGAVTDAENVKHREELHQKQIQQLKELYR